MDRYARIAASLAAVVAPEVASACGGFFCNQSPMDQAGEDIVFAIDEGAGTVTAHIQIDYAGDAEDFAWIVPVGALPELFTSTEQLFDELTWRTQPTFLPTYEEEGDCTGWTYDYSSSYYSSTPSTGYADTGSAGGSTVIVVAEQEIGPYETVILQAESSEGLITWLQANGYDLPAGLDPVLAPYVATDAYFVALRLQSDKTAGDLVPLGLTYAGTKASIPIQLTSVAATPDMRLRVWVFSDARAVPESYLHVQVNETGIDWTESGDNYEEVVTRAADEAGGHAFATDMAGPTDDLQGALWWDGRYDTAALAAQAGPVAFMDELIDQGFPANTTLLNLLIAYLPPPPGLADPTDFYNCVSCYPAHLATLSFDAVALAEAIQATIVDPLIAAEAMFTTHTWVSRLSSSASPAEMTVDPVFVTNPDMAEVAARRDATLVWLCGAGTDYADAELRLELSDGRTLVVPSANWLAANGMTFEDYVEGVTAYDAVIIEATSASGQPTVLADYTNEVTCDPTGGTTPTIPGTDPTTDDETDYPCLADPADEDATEASAKGCGCAHTGGAAGAWLTALVALTTARRRANRGAAAGGPAR